MNIKDLKTNLQLHADATALHGFEASSLIAICELAMQGQYEQAALQLVNLRNAYSRLFALVEGMEADSAKLANDLQENFNKADAEREDIQSFSGGTDLKSMIEYLMRLDPAYTTEAQLQAMWQKLHSAYYGMGFNSVTTYLLQLIFQAGKNYGQHHKP